MAEDKRVGPAELVLASSVARRYYLDGRTKIEIGDEFQLSRFKVARLLETAHSQGLVKIEISQPGSVNLELSERLRDAFDLRHAVVIDADDNHEESLRQQLGRTAAELLTEITTRNDVLGLTWARAVGAMATHLRSLPTIPVVQLTGAMSRSSGTANAADEESSIDVVREVARVARGPAYLFYAPLLVDDAATARAMRQSPRSPSPATDRLRHQGRRRHWLLAAGLSTVYDTASARDRQSLTRQGVCADVGGVFLAADGTPLQTSLTDRMIGIDATQMLAIDQVLAIPYGLRKQPAVLAAVRSGMINSIVTHASLASRCYLIPAAARTLSLDPPTPSNRFGGPGRSSGTSW